MDKEFELAFTLFKPVYSQCHCYLATVNFDLNNLFFFPKAGLIIDPMSLSTKQHEKRFSNGVIKLQVANTQ